MRTKATKAKTPGDVALRAAGINKWFREPADFQVLHDISLEVRRGEFVSIMGKSGCGKSTLLYILSTMDTDYQGKLELVGQELAGLGQTELSRIRNEHIGFVFQFHFLLPEFSVLKNVMIPGLKLGKYPKDEVEHRAMEKLRLLDVDKEALKPSAKLSGGQQQRVAIARALINDPDIIMGDEPTGNLDSANTQNVLSIFRNLAKEFHQTIITVTHDDEFAHQSDRIIMMADGRIVNE